ncbi:uncharacterized protein [Panulirus ornatus]|uniref:uncharacterized protein n=1 Tax=Panulirus ornatus TaxID=150431 RepID=UPI003A8A21CF
MTVIQRRDVEILVSQAQVVLGAGGNGKAFLVPWQEERAVLKVSHKAEDNKLMQEAQHMAHLEGAGGVPRLYATCENPPSIVMSYAGRSTLEDVLRGNNPQGRFDLLQLALLVGHRLQEMHDKGIIHNDLKNDNVIVSGDPQAPQVSIIDLGFACVEHQNLGLNSSPGICLWIAPEVRSGQPSTTASDVYSYAFLLSQVIKQVYRSRRSRLATIVKQAKKEDPSARPTLDLIMKDLQYAIDRSLAA